MGTPLQILIVEDSQDDAFLLLRELKRGSFQFEHSRVETLSNVVAALDRQPWDLIISDHTLPAFSSLHVLELINDRKLDIPFIIVSGTIGEDVAVKAMKAGAHDYVMKNHLARLLPSIERELREAGSRRAKRSAEEALRQSEQELNDFFEHVSVGLHCAGPDGTVLRVNQAELEMLGYNHDEYVGHSISEFYVDKDVAATVQQRLHDGEELNNFETRLRCKNGEIRHVLLNSNVRRENGVFIHSRCFTRDITDRKRAQEAMAYLAAIVESSEDAIIGMTLEGDILSWNASATRMYGYRTQEILGRPMSLLVPHYRPDEWKQIREHVSKGKQLERYETVRRRRDGTTVDVALTFSPIKDSQGEVIGISAIERDITARKNEEMERLKLITELTDALAKIKTLSGLLPICASCKKIRDDRGYWQKIEAYISAHTNAEFTHGICPDCFIRLYPEYTSKRSAAAAGASTPAITKNNGTESGNGAEKTHPTADESVSKN
jgi:PAS domain S-box-containing protein